MSNKVSIIIPVYNTEKYITKCLNSIINQTYTNLEILCINDGSKDNSLSILKDYESQDSRVIVETIPNSGVSKARNIAIKKAIGEYIMFVDSDDYIEKNMVLEMLEAAELNKADIVRCNNFLENSKGKIIKTETYYLKNKSLLKSEITDNIYIDIINGNLLTYSCVLLIKKDTLLKTNLFDEKLKIYEDRVFYLDLFLNLNKVYFLNKPLYHYVINDTSCLNSKKLVSSHLYNTLEGWTSIYNMLNLHKITNDYLIKNLNTKYLEITVGYLYLTYKNEISKFNTAYKHLIKNEVYKEMLKNYDKTQYSLFIKISITLINKRKYHLLKILYHIRKIFSNIKSILIK